jgi:hypothetical protein
MEVMDGEDFKAAVRGDVFKKLREKRATAHSTLFVTDAPPPD